MLLLNDDHSFVPADLLALSLTKVKIVNLEYANLSKEQLTLIYQQISSSSNCNLKYLQIGQSDHTNVDTELLISSLSKLKQMDIGTCIISFDQLMSILLALPIDGDGNGLEYICLFSYRDYINDLPFHLILRLNKGSVDVELSWRIWEQYYNDNRCFYSKCFYSTKYYKNYFNPLLSFDPQGNCL